MKTNFTKRVASLLSAALFLTMTVNAQTVFWSEDFASGIPASWGNFDPTGSGGVWEHDPTDGVAPNWTGQDPFGAATATNGFAFMNSDALGQQPVAHEVELTTSAIDCSAQSIVVLRFQTQAGKYTNDFQIEAGVSTDSMTFTYTALFPDLDPNSFTSGVEFAEVDLSSVAANSSTVYVRFRFTGNFEYDWKIDDIELVDQLTLNSSSIADNYIVTANNYATPYSQVEDVSFGGEVSNNGGNSVTNLSLAASVDFNDGSNTSNVYSEATTIDELAVGEDSILINNTTYLPTTTTGTYLTTYTLSHDSTDANPADNSVSYENIVTSDFYSKGNVDASGLPVNAGGTTIAGGGAYEWADVYHVVNGGYEALTATFAAGADTGLSLDGVTVDITLYRWDDTNADGGIENAELTAVGFNNHSFTTEANYTFIEVDLLDYTTFTKGVALDANTSYLLSFGYAGTQSIFCAAGTGPSFEAALDVSDANNAIRWVSPVSDGTWNSIGFGPDTYPAMKMTISQFPVANKEPILNETQLTILANPAKDALVAQLELETTSGRVAYEISDATGRVLFQTVHTNVLTETFTHDVSEFAAGNYQLTVRTTQGVSTKQFTVVR